MSKGWKRFTQTALEKEISLSVKGGIQTTASEEKDDREEFRSIESFVKLHRIVINCLSIIPYIFWRDLKI